MSVFLIIQAVFCRFLEAQCFDWTENLPRPAIYQYEYSVSFWKNFKEIRVEFFRFFEIFSYFRYITLIKYPKRSYLHIEMITGESSTISGQIFFFEKKNFLRSKKIFLGKIFFGNFFYLYFVELFSLIILVWRFNLFGVLMQALYQKYEKLHIPVSDSILAWKSFPQS